MAEVAGGNDLQSKEDPRTDLGQFPAKVLLESNVRKGQPNPVLPLI